MDASNIAVRVITERFGTVSVGDFLCIRDIGRISVSSKRFWYMHCGQQYLKFPPRTTEDYDVNFILSKIVHMPFDLTYCLRNLSLRNVWKITDVSVVLISENCPFLVTLDMFDCHKVTNAGVVALARKCQFLEVVDLSWCFRVTSVGARALINFCFMLRKLIMYKGENIANGCVWNVLQCNARKRRISLNV